MANVVLDTREPHASTACYSEFRRLADIKENGDFALTFYFDPKSDCGIAACGHVAEPEHWVVSREFLAQ